MELLKKGGSITNTEAPRLRTSFNRGLFLVCGKTIGDHIDWNGGKCSDNISNRFGSLNGAA